MEVLASSENETDKWTREISRTHNGPGMLLSIHQREESGKSDLGVYVAIQISSPLVLDISGQGGEGGRPGMSGDTTNRYRRMEVRVVILNGLLPSNLAPILMSPWRSWHQHLAWGAGDEIC